jgi:hypothetical protein
MSREKRVQATYDKLGGDTVPCEVCALPRPSRRPSSIWPAMFHSTTAANAADYRAPETVGWKNLYAVATWTGSA